MAGPFPDRPHRSTANELMGATVTLTSIYKSLIEAVVTQEWESLVSVKEQCQAFISFFF